MKGNYLVFPNKTDDKSRKMVDRIPTGGVMSAKQNITAPEEGGGLMHCPAPVRRQSPVTLSHSRIQQHPVNLSGNLM